MHTIPVGSDLGGLRAARPAATLATNKDVSHVNSNSFKGKTSSSFKKKEKINSAFFNDGLCRHVGERREEDGNPAEEAGGHDQKPQVCHEPGKFAGKSRERGNTS